VGEGEGKGGSFAVLKKTLGNKFFRKKKPSRKRTLNDSFL